MNKTCIECVNALFVQHEPAPVPIMHSVSAQIDSYSTVTKYGIDHYHAYRQVA